MLGLGFAWAGLGLALYLGLTMRAPPPQVKSESGGRAAVLAAEAFSPDRLAEALGEGRPVLVNMTAAWCITCLVNERLALSTVEVTQAFSDAGILYLKGDWTNRDPAITEYLAGFGRTGAPIYVLYPGAGDPRVLPQILTPAIVDAAIAQEVTDDEHPFGQAMASHARSVFLARIGAWGPALASIDAVVDPPASPYLYFVARGDGTSEFSANLADHNRAVAKYQRGAR